MYVWLYVELVFLLNKYFKLVELFVEMKIHENVFYVVCMYFTWSDVFYVVWKCILRGLNVFYVV